MFVDNTEKLINQKVVVLIRVVFKKAKISFFETAEEISFIKFIITSIINN